MLNKKKWENDLNDFSKKKYFHQKYIFVKISFRKKYNLKFRKNTFSEKLSKRTKSGDLTDDFGLRRLQIVLDRLHIHSH